MKLVNASENGQFIADCLIAVEVSVFVSRRRILSLKFVKLGLVERSVELAESAMLVTEHALFSEATDLLLIESPAILRLKELIVGVDSCFGQLVLSMGKTAVVLIAALGCLDPVLA